MSAPTKCNDDHDIVIQRLWDELQKQQEEIKKQDKRIAKLSMELMRLKSRAIEALNMTGAKDPSDISDNRYRPAGVKSPLCICGHLLEDHDYSPSCLVIEHQEQCLCKWFRSDDNDEDEYQHEEEDFGE